AKSRPFWIEFTAGHFPGSQIMNAFLNWNKPPLTIVADKDRSGAQKRHSIEDEGAFAVIPRKSNGRKPIAHDAILDTMRNIVERFFCKMKDMSPVTRFEKLCRDFPSMQHIFAIKCWIKCIRALDPLAELPGGKCDHFSHSLFRHLLSF
ncbi:MAG: hypothetical protein ABL958_20935, partial [Bdellovibrionia bacterium]